MAEAVVAREHGTVKLGSGQPSSSEGVSEPGNTVSHCRVCLSFNAIPLNEASSRASVRSLLRGINCAKNFSLG